MTATAKKAANTDLWDALSKTDPKHTKPFKRAGGFTGTAIKPIWIIHMLTEQFGPCGVGWGMAEPSFQIVPGDNRELLVYCTVSCWHGDRANTLYGVGGDKVVTHIKANEKYNRPERWESDDEAFKKAFTDAVNNAFKFVGVGADVHMGLFDDSKYVSEVGAEFEKAEVEASSAVPGIHKIKERLRTMMTAGNEDITLAAFKELKRANKDDLKAIRDANHAWWTGDGEDFEGFGPWIARREADLDEDSSVNRAIRDMHETAGDPDALEKWAGNNAAFIETLDGADARRFQTAFDTYAGELAVRCVNAG